MVEGYNCRHPLLAHVRERASGVPVHARPRRSIARTIATVEVGEGRVKTR